MFIGSFIIQYYLMSPIMVSNRIYITNNIGKAYIATIMGLFMVLLEVMMHDHQYHVFSMNFYIILAALLALFVYLYRKQVAINDTQYLEGMIEHHSMALLTSEQVLKKTDNYDVAKLAKNIIQQQEDEIREMRELVKKTNI
jgi:uncharacterized protein (DUF305 family)